MRQSRSGGAFSARQSRGRGFPREQQTPEALGALVKADAEKWWPLIKEFWIKADQGRVSQRPVCAKRRITSTTYGDPVSCRPPVHVPAAILSKVVLVDQRKATSDSCIANVSSWRKRTNRQMERSVFDPKLPFPAIRYSIRLVGGSKQFGGISSRVGS